MIGELHAGGVTSPALLSLYGMSTPHHGDGADNRMTGPQR